MRGEGGYHGGSRLEGLKTPRGGGWGGWVVSGLQPFERGGLAARGKDRKIYMVDLVEKEPSVFFLNFNYFYK